MFVTIGSSFAKTFAMTIGEFGFEDLFTGEDPDTFPVITWFIFIIFLIVMTILLMNMLVSVTTDFLYFNLLCHVRGN